MAGNARQYLTHSPAETISAGRNLAQTLSVPSMVLLRGQLGAGKTTLVKGIVEGFHAASEDTVTSPTFTLVHEYRGSGIEIYHVDLYRIDTLRELETLGLDDLRTETSILLIEWGEKFDRLVRECNLEIALERIGEDDRRIHLSTH